MSLENLQNETWLETALQTQLRPVPAPAGLWNRIQSPRATRAAEAGPTRLLWPVIALLMLLASADLLWEFSKARGSLRQFAQPEPSELAAVAATADACDVYSSDPIRIRQWVKSRSGIEIELPKHSPSARIVGAKVTNVRGTLVASVRYEAAGDSLEKGGTVLVWKSGKRVAGNHLVSDQMAGSEMISWSQGENVFAAVPAEGSSAREACLLCHPEGTHGI